MLEVPLCLSDASLMSLLLSLSETQCCPVEVLSLIIDNVSKLSNSVVSKLGTELHDKLQLVGTSLLSIEVVTRLIPNRHQNVARGWHKVKISPT